jgi:PhnB protein
MQFDPYLHFNGNCEEAFTSYEKIFGGKIDFKLTHGESPMAAQTAPEWRDKIMHMAMRVGDRVLQGTDAPPQYQQPIQGFSVSISVKDLNEGKNIFDALAEGGKVDLPFSETFWSPGFGMLVDRFGVPWMVNTNTAQAA